MTNLFLQSHCQHRSSRFGPGAEESGYPGGSTRSDDSRRTKRMEDVRDVHRPGKDVSAFRVCLKTLWRRPHTGSKGRGTGSGEDPRNSEDPPPRVHTRILKTTSGTGQGTRGGTQWMAHPRDSRTSRRSLTKGTRSGDPPENAETLTHSTRKGQETVDGVEGWV